MRWNVNDKVLLNILNIAVHLRVLLSSSDLNVIFKLIYMQEHRLNAFEARFHDTAENSLISRCTLTDLGLEKVLGKLKIQGIFVT
jgi:hypothetical protein